MLNPQKGDDFTITKDGESYGFGPVGSGAKVIDVTDSQIGMLFEKRGKKEFHNLNGRLTTNLGYWISAKQLSESFTQTEKNITIGKNVKFSNKPGRIIKRFSDNEHLMVELEEHVGGYSGDGEGKAGHCIVIKKENVNFKKGENNL